MLIDDMRELADYRAKCNPENQKHAEVAALLHRLALFGAWASYREGVGLQFENIEEFRAACGDVLERLPRSIERTLSVLAAYCMKPR